MGVHVYAQTAWSVEPLLAVRAFVPLSTTFAFSASPFLRAGPVASRTFAPTSASARSSKAIFTVTILELVFLAFRIFIRIHIVLEVEVNIAFIDTDPQPANDEPTLRFLSLCNLPRA